MLPIDEFLGHSCATAGTILTRVTGIHLDQAGTSLFSFVPQERDEHGPRGVVDVLCKAATRESFHLESFDRYHIIVTYQARARLMEVVGATANRCGVAPSHGSARFTTAPGAFQRRTLKGYGQGRRFRVLMPPLGERLRLIEGSASHMRLSIGVDPLLQRGVVELALRLEDRLEGAMLLLRGQQPVMVGKDHARGPAL